MVNLTGKRCIEESCNTQPSYGIKCGKAEYCSKHKKDDMVNVIHKKCKEETCNTVHPCYGIKGRKVARKL
jgi:hypothetical protein